MWIKVVAPVETSSLDKKYQALVDKINTLDTDTYGLPKKDLLVHLQEAKLAQDETELTAIEAKLQALQDFRDRTGGYNSRVHQSTSTNMCLMVV